MLGLGGGVKGTQEYSGFTDLNLSMNYDFDLLAVMPCSLAW